MGQHQKLDTIHSDLFRSTMRKIASSVAVITTAHDGVLHGMTATAICSVSADPATVLIVVNRSTRSHPLITASKTFVINILAESQRHISDRFSGKADNQFSGIDHRLSSLGSPIIDGAAAHLECATSAETDIGTHTIFIGRVINGGISEAHPLLYHDGAYKYVTPRVSNRNIDPMFLERWSPRAFSDDTISETELMSFFEAARWAPSSLNAQPWRFVYLTRGEEGWADFLQTLSSTNRSWAQNAAALVTFVSKDTLVFDGQPVPSPTHSFDTGAAWMSFALQASLAGWHTHGMAGFKPDLLGPVLRIPTGFTINAVAAIGKIGERSTLPGALKAREVPSDRAPLESLVFRRAWT